MKERKRRRTTPCKMGGDDEYGVDTNNKKNTDSDLKLIVVSQRRRIRVIRPTISLRKIERPAKIRFILLLLLRTDPTIGKKDYEYDIVQ